MQTCRERRILYGSPAQAIGLEPAGLRLSRCRSECSRSSGRRPSVKCATFLAAYERTGNISTASRLANVARSRHYEWMNEPEYAAAFGEAREEAIETLEEQVWKSATVGFEEPVIYQGQLCFEPLRDRNGDIVRDETGLPKPSKIPLTIRKRSDVAAFFLLKALRPEKYRENVNIDHTGSLNLVERLKAGRARLAKLEEERAAREQQADVTSVRSKNCQTG
jgi:hypothetical protein